MLRRSIIKLGLISSILTIIVAGQTRYQDGEAASVSNLLGVGLPSGAARMNEAEIPAEFNSLLDKFVQGGGPKVKRGPTEVLVWAGRGYRRSDGPRMMRDLATNLKTAGWEYEIAEQRDDLTFFIVGRTAPRKQGFVGFWVATGDALVLAVTEMLRADSPLTDTSSANVEGVPTRQGPSDAAVFNLAASDEYVNVMGSQMPKLPAFPVLGKKPGRVRGYVRDLNGRPLQGAYIGVRSSAVGGFYSGARAETDANGYYEIAAPWGAAEFYAAGYTIDYGEGRAAVSLYPVDGKAGSFVASDGAVENFVLIFYGPGDRNSISERPYDGANYYGGSIRVSYSLGSAGDMWARKGSLPENSEIEITLVPDGTLLDVTSHKTFVIRRKTGGVNNFNIVNIPVGQYKISARLSNGKQLKMSKSAYDSKPLFGLKPSEAVGTASLLFVPSSAEPRSGHPGRGSWSPANVELQMP